MNTNIKMIVMLANIIMPNMAYRALGISLRKNPIGVRATDTITVPYTDIPMKQDSFSETILTLRVSKARKSPINKIQPLYANNAINQMSESSDVQIPIITGRSPSYRGNSYNNNCTFVSLTFSPSSSLSSLLNTALLTTVVGIINTISSRRRTATIPNK